MKPPEIVNATQAELDELLAKAKPTFSTEQYLLLERVFGTFVYVMLSLQNAKTSIKRFQRMLFGHRTEHKRNVLERAAQTDQSGESDALDADPVPALPGVVPVPVPRPPQPGHGRNAAQAYSGAPIVQCDHPDLDSGDRCPQCDKGRVYDSPPGPSSRWWVRRRWGPRCTSCSGCAAGCATPSSPPPCPRRWPPCPSTTRAARA